MISRLYQKEPFIGSELFLDDLREGLRNQGFAQVGYYQKVEKSRVFSGWHSVTLPLSVLRQNYEVTLFSFMLPWSQSNHGIL